MDKQSRDARNMAKKLPFVKKVEYFWQYYKWQTAIVIFLIIAVVSTIHIITTREKYDLEISYYGVNVFSDEQITLLEDYLSNYIEDIDGNGEKKVKINPVISDMPGTSMQQMRMMTEKLVAELTACTYPAYLFDQDFCDKMGPKADKSVMECAIDIRENKDISNIIGPLNEPVYWCTRMLYDREKDKEKNVFANKNAKLAEYAVASK